MRKKGIVYFLTAAMLIGATTFPTGNVHADEPTVIETGDDASQADTDDAASQTDTDDVSQVDGDNDFTAIDTATPNDPSEQEDENPYVLDVNEAVDAEDEANSKWITEYEYVLDGNYIKLKRYLGTSSEIHVYKKAKIDGKTYYTLIGSDFEGGRIPAGIWGDDDGRRPEDQVNYITFEDGVKFDKNCSTVFSKCYNLKSLDLSKVDMSDVESTKYMFMVCESLESVDLGEFTAENVTEMSWMFYLCKSLETLDLSHFNTKNVTDMSGMFNNCYSLKSVDVSSFETSNCDNFSEMFMNCKSLKTLDLSSFDFSKTIPGAPYDYYNSEYMLIGCESLETVYTPRNVNISIMLPYDFMFDAKGNVVMEIPQNVSTTKKLTKKFTGWRKVEDRYAYFNNSDILESDVILLCKGYINNKNNWYAASDGYFDNTFTGIAQYEGKSGWGFAKDGVYDTTFAGLAKATNDKWYYVKNGRIDKTFTQKIAETTDGKWYYCTDGRPDLKFSGKLAYCTNGNWYYVTKGKIDRSFTGIAEATNGNQYYAVKGVLAKNFTGTVEYKGKKYKIKNGKVVG